MFCRCFKILNFPPVISLFGKISAQPHTSLCMHILRVIQRKINPYIMMHNKVWGCAKI